MDGFLTFNRAAIFHDGFAIVALNEQQMATFIFTIRMIVARFSALVALRHDIVGNTFAQTVIEYEILTDELAF